MKNIEKLANLVLENGDLPAPQVATVEPQVRTGLLFPLPSWTASSKQSQDAEASSDLLA